MKRYLIFIVTVMIIATTFNFPLRCEKVFATGTETGAIC